MQGRRAALGLFLFFLGVYVLCGSARFFSVDEIAVYQTARYWWTGEPVAPSHITTAGRSGRHWSNHGPMLAVLALPLFGLGEAFVEVLPERWQRSIAGERSGVEGVDWSGDVQMFPVLWLNALVTAALVAVFYRLMLHFLQHGAAALLTAFLLGTTTLLFGHTKNLFTHSLVACLAVIGLATLVRAKESGQLRWFTSAGLICAAMMLTRLTSAPVIACFALYLFVARVRLADGRRVAAFVLPVLGGVVCYLGYNAYRYGTLTRVGYTSFGGFDTPLLVGLYGHLLSVGRSIFVYSPLLVLGLACLPKFARRHLPEAVFVVSVAAASLAVYGTWFDWPGGWCFGNRFLLPLVPLLMLPVGVAVKEALDERRWALRVGIAGLAAAGFFVQVLALAVNISFVYHHYGFWNPANRDDTSFLFSPTHNQLVAHVESLSQGKNIDFWVARTLADLGVLPTVALAAPFLLCIVLGALCCVRARRGRFPLTPTTTAA